MTSRLDRRPTKAAARRIHTGAVALHLVAASIAALAAASPSWAAPSATESGRFRSRESLAREAQLPVATAGALIDAHSSGEFDVRILRRGRGPSARTLVLAGERHFKGPRGAELGRRLVERFALRGGEGADLSKYWSKPLVDATLWLSEKLFRVHKLVTSRGRERTHSSTIDVAQRTGPGESFVALEKGHRPGLGEQLGALYTPALFALAGASVLTTTVLRHAIPPEAALAISGANLAAFFHQFAHSALRRLGLHLENYSWGPFVAPQVGLLAGRNQTMARNIDRALDEHGEKEMLAIVGKDHVPGMARELRRRYGFVEVPITAER